MNTKEQDALLSAFSQLHKNDRTALILIAIAIKERVNREKAGLHNRRGSQSGGIVSMTAQKRKGKS